MYNYHGLIKMNSNNIVAFPKAYSGPKETITVEDVDNKIDTIKQYHIQETLTNIIPIIFTNLDISGFSIDDDFQEDKTLKDGALIVESIRSFMCKYYGIYHPFQKLADNVFESDIQDVDSLNIVDEINVKLKEDIS